MTKPVPGYLLALAAAALWSTLGPITRILLDTHHLSSLNIAFLRGALSSATFLIGLSIFRRDLIKPPPGTLWQLVVLGVIGVGAFYIALAQGVKLAGIALLSVLVNVAPICVTLVSAIFFHEPLTPKKLIVLALAVVGGALVVKIYDPGALRLSWPGILAGLAAYTGYVFFASFSKSLSGKCDPRTMLTYAFGIAAFVLLPLQGGEGLAAALQPAAWPFIIALIAGPTLGAWASFSLSLRHIPVSNSTIVVSMDAVFSNIWAFIFFRELLESPQLFGGALILLAVILLQLELPQRAKQPEMA